jgi:hypothetical protein
LKTFIPAILLAVLATALAACGGSSHTTSAGSGSSGSRALTDRDVSRANLKLGQRQSAVRSAFGPPFAITVQRTPAGRLNCDLYHKVAPANLPESLKIIKLCYRDGVLDVINVP